MLAGLAGRRVPVAGAAEEHELELLLGTDAAARRRVRRPAARTAAEVPGAATRANLALTLRAWLRSPGQRKTIASELGVHPQTVRYRMARLRELFGELLDDPDGRFELELALRLQTLRRARRAESPRQEARRGRAGGAHTLSGVTRNAAERTACDHVAVDRALTSAVQSGPERGKAGHPRACRRA